jgi:hypothetical protein
MIRLFTAASALALLAAAPAAGQDMPHMQHAPASQPDAHAGHVAPPPAAPSVAEDLSQVSQTPTKATPSEPAMAGHDMSKMQHGAHQMAAALGSYPVSREASGTAWQPDASPHAGVMAMRGDWMLMGHALLNAVYDWQDGPRGGDKAFGSGMVMGMATRQFAGGDALQLRAMLSPDPFMGKRGYPLLLASGETADGVTPLVDRQHPHDLFMELSASYSHKLTEVDSVFLYAGLPGEPAFGPPAFMHRLSIMDSPEAPISHHWLDSTHIVFGVITAGYVHDNWKLEVSRFKGREPDDHRWDIENPKLDSTAARVSFNPTDRWALQASWAQVKSPEQLEPEQDQTKWSASAIYTVPLGADGWWSTTAAWGRRSAEHDDLNAYALESAVKPNDRWTVFGRAERTENNELTGAAGHHGATYTVSKVSLGAIRDWRVSEHLKLGLGGLYAWNVIPGGLDSAYGGDPSGAMAFVRLKVE